MKSKLDGFSEHRVQLRNTRVKTLVLYANQEDPPAGPFTLSLQVFPTSIGTEPGVHRSSTLVESFRSPAFWDPLEIFNSYFQVIEEMRFRDGSSAKISETRLRGLGADLFEKLFPTNLQNRLLDIYRSSLIPIDSELNAPVFSLISNETWIPWELLRLGREGPFLAEAFAFCRWLSGWEAARRLPLSKISWVSFARAGLREAPSELEGLRELFGHRVFEVEARHETVLSSLADSESKGWHFACHGRASGKKADLGSIELEDSGLVATDLSVGMPGVASHRPFVFLNSCSAARGGPSLTGLGGFAQAFIKAGSGAFLGPHWAVSEAAAAVFSVVFYRHLLGGLPLAESVRRARLQIKNQFSGDPTWLAYSIYGDPWALAGQEVDEEFLDAASCSCGLVEVGKSVQPPQVARRSGSRFDLLWIVLVLVLVLSLGWLANRSIDRTVQGNRDRVSVAVFRPENQSGDPELDWVCTLFAEALHRKLEIGESLLVLDQIEVALFEQEIVPSTLWQASETELEIVRRGLGVDYFIVGRVLRTDRHETIQLEISLRDSRTGLDLASGHEIGELDRWANLLDRVTGGNPQNPDFRRFFDAAPLKLGERDALLMSFPNVIEAARLLGQSLNSLYDGRFREAWKDLEEAVQFERHPGLLLLLAEAAYWAGQWERAEEVLSEALSFEDSMVREQPLSQMQKVQVERSLLAARIRFDREKQIAAYAELHSREPDNLVLGILFAEALIDSGDPEGAQLVLDELRRLPNSQHIPSIDITEARSLMARQMYQATVDRGRIALEKSRALKLQRDEALAQAVMAAALGEMGGGAREEAATLFRQARTTFDEVEDILSAAQCLELSAVFYEEFDLKTAESLLMEAIERYEGLGEQASRIRALFRLGTVQEARGHTEDAEQSIGLAQELASDRFAIFQGYFVLARGYRLHLAGALKGAHREYDFARKLFHREDTKDGYGTVLTNLGELEFLQGRFTVAEDLHRQALKIHESVGAHSSAAYDNLRIGLVYAAQGKLQLARKLYSIAMQQEDDSASSGDVGTSVTAEIILAQAQADLQSGRVGVALGKLQGASELAQSLDDSGLLARVSAMKANVLLEADLQQGKEVSQRTVQALEQAEERLGLDFRADFEMGWVAARIKALHSADGREGIHGLHELVSRAREQGLKIHELISRYWLGRQQLDSGDVEFGTRTLSKLQDDATQLGFGSLDRQIDGLLMGEI